MPNPFHFDPAILVGVVGATIVKLITSPFHSVWRAAATVVSAVIAAWIFTDPALAILKLDPDIYKAAMAALLALTGEGLMRFVISVSRDPKQAIALWQQLRGGGKK